VGLLLSPSVLSPSDWIVRWTHLIKPDASVLDIACGSGRHLQWFAQRGHAVTGVDRDLSATQLMNAALTLVEADIENHAWPLTHNGAPEPFDAVIVTNYLWRPLLPTVLASLAPGGVLLYETFAVGNETLGRPSRPDFLLKTGELLEICKDLHIVAYEHGILQNPPRFVQRIAAVRLATHLAGQTPPTAFAL
jgi:SAM-dependent methyltransferase